MHYWEISMIFFCSGNLGKDLRTTIKKKRLCRKKEWLLISLSEQFNILRLKKVLKMIWKTEKVLHVNNIELASQFEISFFFMSQNGKLVMIALLQIKKWVTECLFFVCLYFHLLDLWEILSAALYFTSRKSKTKNQNQRKVKHKTKERFITVF